MEDKRIERVIYQAFEIGKHKDLSVIQKIYHKSFTKFSNVPPYTLQDFSEASLHQELFFANISDYDFVIKDLRINIFGDIAIATFMLEEHGMIVDDYSFTGNTINIRSRVSMILKKDDDKWLILHEHISSI